jgi:transposase-like protein
VPVLTRTPEQRREVVRLVAGGGSNREIAARFDCAPSSVAHFRSRHAEEIQALRAKLAAAADAQENLWISHRLDRLGVLQDSAEQLIEAAETASESALPEITRTLVSVLHEAAEQLGQLPARTTINSTTVVNYRIEGVDLEAL